MDISSFRREYLKGGLQRKDLEDDPLKQFTGWFEEARKTDIPDPTAMILATVSAAGRPSQRTVLLKYFDSKGFVFFTNYASRKAKEIAENTNVSLLFVWLELERQILINGRVEKVTSAESAKYFISRPRDSQVAAWISHQSDVVSSRKMLLLKFDEMKRKLGEKKLPIPSFWGGYRVVPEEYEFWQGRKNRLHDRFHYMLEQGKWQISRLAP